MKKDIDYSIQLFPSSRLFTMDIGKLGLRKHHIKALIEIDVADSMLKLKKIKAETGKQISFTSWILKCISQAVAENKQVHALRKGKNRLVIFNDIDISVIVEKDLNGVPVPIPVVIRNTDRKSIQEIYNEIEEAKRQEVVDEKLCSWTEQNKTPDKTVFDITAVHTSDYLEDIIIKSGSNKKYDGNCNCYFYWNDWKR